MTKEIMEVVAAEIEMMGGPMLMHEMLEVCEEAGYPKYAAYGVIAAGVVEVGIAEKCGAPLYAVAAPVAAAKPAGVIPGCPAPWA